MVARLEAVDSRPLVDDFHAICVGGLAENGEDEGRGVRGHLGFRDRAQQGTQPLQDKYLGQEHDQSYSSQRYSSQLPIY